MVVQLFPMSDESCSINRMRTGNESNGEGRGDLGMTHPLVSEPVRSGERSAWMSAIPNEFETMGQEKSHSPISERVAQ